MLDEFNFKFDQNAILYMTPGQNSKLNVLKNEPLHLFLFLNKDFKENSTEVEISYFDSTINKVKITKIVI